MPSVAVFGQTIAVTWLSDTAGTVRIRSSANGGSTWSATTSLGSGAVDRPSISIAAGRIGVVWTDGVGPIVLVQSSSVWGAPVFVPTPAKRSLGGQFVDSYSPQLALFGTSTIGVAWSACWQDCVSYDTQTQVDVLWAESSTNGATWVTPDDASPAFPYLGLRDDASIVWPAAGTRLVLLNAYGATDRLLVVAGTSDGAVPAGSPTTRHSRGSQGASGVREPIGASGAFAR